MSTDLLNKVLRVGEGRAMKGMQGRVGHINDLEPAMEKLSDAEMRAKTDEFRARLQDGEASTTSSTRRSRSSARPAGGSSACASSTCSSSGR